MLLSRGGHLETGRLQSAVHERFIQSALITDILLTDRSRDGEPAAPVSPGCLYKAVNVREAREYSHLWKSLFTREAILLRLTRDEEEEEEGCPIVPAVGGGPSDPL